MDAPSASPPAAERTVVWRLRDGKAGHENQSAGLVEALWRLQPLQVIDLPVMTWRQRLQVTRLASGLPAPGLVVGAGHATHRSLLQLSDRFGGRSVVLMRPTLAPARFNLCVIPRHDAPAVTANVLVTDGVLNRVRPHVRPREDTGLVLIGGPSRHHDWLDRELTAQVAAVLAADPARAWCICDSRRTPRRTMSLLANAVPSPRYVHWGSAAPGWLAEQLATTRTVWVSEDSVSMVYESLTAGAGVGLLAVPRRRRSRVTRGLADLVARGLVTPFVLWQGGRALTRPAKPLAEADRVASWIWSRWLRRPA